MKARPAKTHPLRSISEKQAKRLSLVCVLALVLIVVLLGVLAVLEQPEEKQETTTYAMGSFVQQTVYGENREAGAVQAADAVQALENRISWRVENSDIQKLNFAAGQDWTQVHQKTIQLLEMTQAVSAESDGAFSVLIAPLSRLWDFDNDRQTVPEDEEIQALLPCVSYSDLRLDADTLTASLKWRYNALDLGAVGKGAACDAACEAYEAAGVSAAILSVGGSVGTYGQKKNGSDWTIAVRDPDTSGTLGTLQIAGGFLSTSGSYEKQFVKDGVQYHHILDPRTGYPAESGLVSVTVLAESGALSDALSTACFVLGREKSLPLLQAFHAEALFIDTQHRIHLTDGLRQRFSLSADGYTLQE